ncbi:hypothetical protein DL98DRAFT_195392 [Cadophora sp. DSE1049]|nr:hypothetical protein DL98DRAFT_195392 [Cadophora sp. DSE1049]
MGDLCKRCIHLKRLHVSSLLRCHQTALYLSNSGKRQLLWNWIVYESKKYMLTMKWTPIASSETPQMKPEVTCMSHLTFNNTSSTTPKNHQNPILHFPKLPSIEPTTSSPRQPPQAPHKSSICHRICVNISATSLRLKPSGASRSPCLPFLFLITHGNLPCLDPPFSVRLRHT